jgi:hypothetical protein
VEFLQPGRLWPTLSLPGHASQALGHHPHIHAVVPGGGPSLHGNRWISSRHPTDRRRRKPFLIANLELGRLFRNNFIAGLRRLVKQRKLRLEGEWSRLLNPASLETWLAQLGSSDWNVFIEGPPNGNSDPKDVFKYLARYLTGGPISERRIVSDVDGQVTFLARSQDKQAGTPPIEIELPGAEFLRRWSMHILPKGFTKSRCCGGYHGSKRQDYLAQCRSLLPIVQTAESEPPSDPPPLDPQAGIPSPLPQKNVAAATWS